MEDQALRSALQRHWDASDANDFETEHDIYHDDAVLHYPQSGERIRGRRNIQESRFVQPNKKRFTVQRMTGSGVANFRVCHPLLVSFENVPVRRSSPPADQMAPRWVPVLPAPL